MRHALALAVSAAVVLTAACSETGLEDSDPTGPSLSISDGGPSPSLNLYGLGLVRASPRMPCTAAPYREFDFWIGAWDVFNPAGVLVGANTIASELDGCVIAEHWTAANGTRGRSINTYDAETGQWHQTWASTNTFGHLRLAGGVVNGEMVMSGVRDPSVFGVPLFDEFTWTILDPDRVRQVGVLRIPAIGLVSSFTGIYERVDEITPLAEAPTTECMPSGISAETRRLDFLVGDWTVEAEQGLVIGRSMIRTDLRDCLFEERFTTSKGYQAVAFTYWDRNARRWHRTYIDTEGERLELAGLFDGPRLVLQGTDRVPGGTVEVRVSLEPVASGGVLQTLEISRDGGDTWNPSPSLRFVD